MATILIGSLWIAACTRGKSPQQRASTKAAAVPVTAAPAPEPSDWQAGQLSTVAADAKPQTGGSLVVVVRSEPPSLNPLLHNDWLGQRIAGQVYEALVRPDPYTAPEHPIGPGLAERWTVSPDQREYTFFLRRNVRWHDGKPFTAADVIATLDKVTDPTTLATQLRASLKPLERYEQLDAHTVRIYWKTPYFLALDMLADVFIQPAHVLRKLSGKQFNEAAHNPLQRKPLGTGPFVFRRWQAGSQLEFTRNPGYWDRPAHVEELIFRVVQDPTVRQELALHGEVDVWTGVEEAQWAAMDAPVFRRNFQRSRVDEASYTFIAWNARAKPFLADARVRRAFTLLLDRERIAQSLFFGLRKLTACHFYWASAACAGLQPLPYAPAEAAELLRQAGYRDHDGDGLRDKDNAPLAFRFMLVAGSANSTKLGAVIKEVLGRSGVGVTLETVEWGTYLKRLRSGEFEAGSLVWSSPPRSDPAPIWHSSAREGGSNYVGFAHAEADRLIEAAQREMDPARRQALYRELGQVLQEQQPYTWLFVHPRLTLLHRRVRGARQSLMGWQFRDLWLDGPRRILQ